MLYVMTDENDEVRQPYSENVPDVYAMLQLDPNCCCIVKVREKLIHNLDSYSVEFCDVMRGCLGTFIDCILLFYIVKMSSQGSQSCNMITGCSVYF